MPKTTAKKLAPIHPGEILEKEFLTPMGITQYRLAQDLKVPRRRINEIVHGKRGISADTALRLTRYFGTSSQFWMNLQMHYELRSEEQSKGAYISKSVPVYAAEQREIA